MGLEALRQVSLKDHGSLMEAQIRGWLMFSALFDRMAELCAEKPVRAKPELSHA
jgi:hypothetical protein